jgi:hypothetical protein
VGALAERLDSGVVAGLVADAGPSREALYEAARPGRLHVLLASAWELEGGPVPPQARDELEFWRRQMTAYADVFAGLATLGLSAQKGPQLARLYPRGWLRQSTDLDLFAAGRAPVWDAARTLVADGWEVAALTVLVAEGEPGVTLEVGRPSDRPDLLREQKVELASLAFAGNQLGVPAVRTLGNDVPAESPVHQLVALVEERFQRPFRDRDVLDAALLLEEMGDGERALLAAVLDSTRLWPEWRELRAWIVRAALLDAAEVPPAPLRAVAAARARRARTVAVRAREPATWAWLLASDDDPGRGRAALAALLERRVPVGRVLARGYAAYGVPVALGQPSAEDLAVVRREGDLVAETPLGTFLLTYAAAVDESRIAALAAAV